MTPAVLVGRHPEVTRVLARLDVTADMGARQVAGLCARHGQAVAEVMEHALRDPPEDRTPDSLTALYVAIDQAPVPALAVSAPPPVPERLLIEVDAGRKVARVGGSVLLRKAKLRDPRPSRRSTSGEPRRGMRAGGFRAPDRASALGDLGPQG